MLASGLLLYESPDSRTMILLVIAVWSFCRFYYFLFYVLERYAGRDQKYAGVMDALVYVLKSCAAKREEP